MIVEYKIAEEFTDTPGPRNIREGEKSGELFLRDVLLPMFRKAKADNNKLSIDLDGTFGYPPSFLDEAFGGLVQKTNLSKSEILEILSIKSSRKYYIVQIYEIMSIWEKKH